MYLDYYGLRELPFNITPSPRFMYLSDAHAQAMDHLMFGVQLRRGFIVLTGDVGTGKTTLCRALLDRLDDRYRTALILDPCLSDTQLLRAILHELGCPDAKGDRLTLRERLYQLLLDEFQAGRDVVLVIDEAQHLTYAQLEQVRLLSNFENDDRKLLQIVLSGQPELDTKLAAAKLRQLRQRVTVRYRLRPINSDETNAYIRHRLTVAGGNGRPSFADAAVEEIHARSSGIPRLVNAISDISLLAAFASQNDCVTCVHVAKAVDDLRESLE